MTGVLIAIMCSGSGGGSVLITDQEIHDITAGPTAQSEYTLGNDGIAYETTSTSGTDPISGEWKLAGAVADYEARATENSGTVTSGPIGTWDSLATTRTWVKDRGSIGTSTVELLIEIRRAADSVVLDSAVITLIAEVS